MKALLFLCSDLKILKCRIVTLPSKLITVIAIFLFWSLSYIKGICHVPSTYKWKLPLKIGHYLVHNFYVYIQTINKFLNNMSTQWFSSLLVAVQLLLAICLLEKNDDVIESMLGWTKVYRPFYMIPRVKQTAWNTWDHVNENKILKIIKTDFSFIF